MGNETDVDRAEFSVYQWFVDGSQEEVLSWVRAEPAVKCACSLARSVGGRMGTTRKIMITDGADCCVWEWRWEYGIVFPEGLRGRLKKGVN